MYGLRSNRKTKIPQTQLIQNHMHNALFARVKLNMADPKFFDFRREGSQLNLRINEKEVIVRRLSIAFQVSFLPMTKFSCFQMYRPTAHFCFCVQKNILSFPFLSYFELWTQNGKKEYVIRHNFLMTEVVLVQVDGSRVG